MQNALFLYLEQPGVAFLIAVKLSRHKVSPVIKDRLTYGRKTQWQASNRECQRESGFTWTPPGMSASEWVMENWRGSATILPVRCKGTRDGKPLDDSLYYVSNLGTCAKELLQPPPSQLGSARPWCVMGRRLLVIPVGEALRAALTELLGAHDVSPHQRLQAHSRAAWHGFP